MAFCYRGDTKHLIGGDCLNGAARVQGPFRPLTIVFSDGLGWEHVSVSTPNRAPNWEEMCFIKDLFWAPEDVVIQFHPARSSYVNNHPNCLHLWRPQGLELPVPPVKLVGTL